MSRRCNPPMLITPWQKSFSAVLEWQSEERAFCPRNSRPLATNGPSRAGLFEALIWLRLRRRRVRLEQRWAGDASPRSNRKIVFRVEKSLARGQEREEWHSSVHPEPHRPSLGGAVPWGEI